MCPIPRRCRGFQSSRILLQGVALRDYKFSLATVVVLISEDYTGPRPSTRERSLFRRVASTKLEPSFPGIGLYVTSGNNSVPGLMAIWKNLRCCFEGSLVPLVRELGFEGPLGPFKGQLVKGYASRDSCPSGSKLGSRDHLDFREDSLLPKIVVFATH